MLFKFSYRIVLLPLLFVLLMWAGFWLKVNGVYLSSYGIYPKTFFGLRGVLFSPFIHGDLNHLWSNTLPMFLLFAALLYFYRKYAITVFLLGWLLSGLLTWLIGRPSFHIGASGLIYMLFTFLFFMGIFSKNRRLIALSLVVVFVYGGMIWFITPIKPEISWEGHLSGFFTGILLALIYMKKLPPVPVYPWEKPDFEPNKDPFMRQFDESGNFLPEEPEIDLEVDNETKPPNIHIHYKPKKDL